MSDTLPVPAPGADWSEIGRCARAWVDALPDDWEARLDAREFTVPEWVLDHFAEMMEAEVELLQAAGLVE